MKTNIIHSGAGFSKKITLAALLIGAASLSAVQAVTLINSLPYVISKRGQYALAGNLELAAAAAPGAAAITIRADNVHLDLSGFVLKGNNTQDLRSVGILVEGECDSSLWTTRPPDPYPDTVLETLIRARRQVRISGGEVTGFRYGIEFAGVTQSHITDMVVQRNFRGIWLHCHSSQNHIKHNTVMNQICCGIRLDNAHDNVLVLNDSSNNGSQGMLLWRSNSNNINNNVLNNNFVVGLVVFSQSTANHIAHNTALNNNRHPFLTGGIVLGWPGARHATATGNFIVANTAFGNDRGLGAKGDVADFHLLFFGDCANAWHANDFGLELGESDGPDAGCIQ